MEAPRSCSTGAAVLLRVAQGGAWRRPVLWSVVLDTLGRRPRPSDGLQVGEDRPDMAVGPTRWPVKAARGASALARGPDRQGQTWREPSRSERGSTTVVVVLPDVA